MLQDRKNEHLDIVLGGLGRSRARTGFDDVAFEHVALPELDMDNIDLSTDFLGRRINAPLLVSSMTGGPARAADINRNLAIACGELGIALAVGSQRIAIEGQEHAGFSAELRRHAPDIPLLGNIGAAQLNLGFGIDQARRAIDMIGADALIIHLNPLQEALQPEGDRNWRGLIGKIEQLARDLGAPLVVKEVGAGISATLAKRLADAGVAAIDIAGAGGTSWAVVEAERARAPEQAEIARLFADWGIPTAEAIAEARAACPQTVIIGSGGIRNGLDVAKAIRLGANVVGQAGGLIEAATRSPDDVIRALSIMTAQLRVACFCTGSANLAMLSNARLRRVG